MAKQFLHHVGEPTEIERASILAAIEIYVEDGMVPPNNWDERVLTCGETVIDEGNIERILGAKKP
jgi:hypothetical protein